MTTLQQSIDDVVASATGIDWSISIRDATGDELARHDAERAMKTASIGKLLLLIEIARRCETGDLSGDTLLSRDPELHVGDSGLWQHLRAEQLAVADLGVLIASVSDNLATNVMLKEVGLQSVHSLAGSLGLVHTALVDYVRDVRGPGDPDTLSTGAASELSHLMNRLSRHEVVSPAVSEQVNAWLATGVDLSMVASAFCLDPLAHACSDRDMVICNKTGADRGVKADVGTVSRGAAGYSYAVIANWDTCADLDAAALAGMSAVGAALQAAIDSYPA